MTITLGPEHEKWIAQAIDTFEQQWIQAIVAKWGLATSGGQPYYRVRAFNATVVSGPLNTVSLRVR